MKTALQLVAVLAAFLLLPLSCQDLFRPDTPDKPDSPPDDAYDILTAREHAGESGVWVQGYIVGTAAGSKNYLFCGPYTKNSNLILGLSDTTTVREHCLAVQLPAGQVRDALNLVDHPELTGREVYIKGDLVDAYYGIPGLKSPSDYWMN